MRNDARPGLALLLLATTSLSHGAEPGSWFAASPCAADTVEVVSLAGARALLAVHHQPGEAPREALLLMGADGLWRAPAEDWSRWTPRPARHIETAADGTRWVPLKAAPDLALRLDSCSAELWVDADPERLHVATAARPAAPPVAAAGRGGFVNVDAQYGGLSGAGEINSLLDAGVFSAAGSGRSAFFASNRELLRLESRWTHDDPARALRLALGDSITASADWESAARFGGVQWGTDFSLQPERITFPLPSIAGTAAVPTTAELFVNGQRQSSEPLQPGNFRFDSVPTLTGAGELSVVVRDALGREQTVRQSFYTSPRLLAEGLSAYTVEGGLLRANFATDDDQYRDAFAATTLRTGLSGTLTGSLRAVVSVDRSQLGGGLDWVAGTLGVFSVTAATSHSEAGVGGIATLGFEHAAPRYSFSVRRRMASRDYGDLGRRPGTLHFSDTARAALKLGRGGSASLLYVSEQAWDGSGARLAGAAYSVGLGPRLQGYASALRALSGTRDTQFSAGLAVSFGQRNSGGVQWNRESGRQSASVAAQHTPEGQLGWTYGAAVDGRERGIRQGAAALATARGNFGLGVAGFGSTAQPSALLQTGVAVLDGHGYWTRPVQQSFAAVETGRVAGVHVYRENQLVGTTGTGGRLLVPDLQPFMANQLRIDDHDLPLGVSLGSGTAVSVPPANAGVTVRFAVAAERPLTLHLKAANGVAIPAGALLRLDGKTLPLPSGYDGLVYAEMGEGSHRLRAEWPGGHCESEVMVRGAVASAEPCGAPGT